MSTLLNRASFYKFCTFLQVLQVFTSVVVTDVKTCNKIIKKVKQQNVVLKFTRLGNIEELHLEMFADACLGNIEEGIHTKSAIGYFIALANKKMDQKKTQV